MQLEAKYNSIPSELAQGGPAPTRQVLGKTPVQGTTGPGRRHALASEPRSGGPGPGNGDAPTPGKGPGLHEER